MNIQPINPPMPPCVCGNCQQCGSRVHSLSGFADLDSVGHYYCSRDCAEVKHTSTLPTPICDGCGEDVASVFTADDCYVCKRCAAEAAKNS